MSASTKASTASGCLAMSSSMACDNQSGQVCIGCICPSMMANTCSPCAKNSTFLSAMPAGSLPVMAVFILLCMADGFLAGFKDGLLRLVLLGYLYCCIVHVDVVAVA